jgi:hypothetical protein
MKTEIIFASLAVIFGLSTYVLFITSADLADKVVLYKRILVTNNLAHYTADGVFTLNNTYGEGIVDSLYRISK